VTGNDSLDRPVTRRGFLRIGGLAAAGLAALLAGCRPSSSVQTTSGGSVAIDRGDGVAATTPAIRQSAQAAPAAAPTVQPKATATPKAAATVQPDGGSIGAAPAATPATQAVYVACQYGVVDDPYPGRCKRYRDLNGNGYCDLSVPGSGNVLAGSGNAPQRPGR
jgi:hypothetical protein